MIQEFLKRVPLFEGLGDDDLAQLLMVGLVRRYNEGVLILAEGSAGRALRVIRKGQVRIGKVIPGVGEEALAILRPGEFFGELELLDGAPAAANAVAHTRCEIFSIPHNEILSLMRGRPELGRQFLLAFGRTLAERLRSTNQQLASFLALAKDL